MESRRRGSESERWSTEWREQVSQELASSAEKHQQTAIIQERILGKLEQHDEDIRALQQRPAGFRNDLSAYGGCAYMAIATAFGSIMTVVGLISLAVAIWVDLHK